jgi:hypothetical protein
MLVECHTLYCSSVQFIDAIIAKYARLHEWLQLPQVI